MKTRQYLVSNSSSSSFVLVVDKEEFNRVYDKLHPYEKSVVDTITSEDTCFGNDVKLISYYYTPGGGMWDYMDIEYTEENYSDYAKDHSEDYMYPGEIVSKFESQLYKSVDESKRWGHGVDF